MTDREKQGLMGVLEHLSDWMLGILRDNPKAVSEYAANELIVRSVKRSHASK